MRLGKKNFVENFKLHSRFTQGKTIRTECVRGHAEGTRKSATKGAAIKETPAYVGALRRATIKETQV